MLIRCYTVMWHLSHTINMQPCGGYSWHLFPPPGEAKTSAFPCFRLTNWFSLLSAFVTLSLINHCQNLLCLVPHLLDRNSPWSSWSNSSLHLLQRLANRSFALLSVLSAPSSFLSRSAFSVVTLFTRSQWWHSLLLYYSRCIQWMHRLMKCPHNTDVSLISATAPWPVSHILQHVLPQQVSHTERWLCCCRLTVCLCVTYI